MAVQAGSTPPDSFRDQGWSHRFTKMGDEAEAVFEAVWPSGWARYGLNRPPIQMHKLPPLLRYTPDYLCSSEFVEVQGFGRDQTLKLKVEKQNALLEWHHVHPVTLFVWDSTNREWTTVRLLDLVLLCKKYGEARSFPEGKTYWAIPKHVLPKPWTAHDEA